MTVTLLVKIIKAYNGMKYKILIMLLFIFPVVSFGQKYSLRIDSTAKRAILNSGAVDKIKFETLLRYCQSKDVFKRIDSIDCDYIYVEAYCNERDTNVGEWYFNTVQQGKFKVMQEMKSGLPSMVFNNGDEIDFRMSYFSNSTAGVVFDNLYETYYTLEEIKERVKTMKVLQELTYDPSPAINTNMYNNRITDSSQSKDQSIRSMGNSVVEKIIIHELKNTHKFIVWVDKKTGTFSISFQTPAKVPKIKSYPVHLKYQEW